MNQCPSCKSWTLEYDDYFGRYRCFNPDCGWMSLSSAELALRSVQSNEKPKLVTKGKLPGTDINTQLFYDRPNDALIFDFGIEEATFDLPEPNGRFIWKISNATGTAIGFVILGAKKFGVSGVAINVLARKESLEQNVRRFPKSFLPGRPSKLLIASVEVTESASKAKPQDEFFVSAIKKFEAEYCTL